MLTPSPMTTTPKPGKCRFCKKRLDKVGEKLHQACVQGWYDANRDKVRGRVLKVERAATRARRKALETIPELIAAAQKEFNAYIRLRDKGRLCICCGKAGGSVDGLRAHGWDAGHYRSTGSAPHLRFDERNVHRQLVHCNRHGAGRAVDYRIGLVVRIGLAAVEALEADNRVKKWDRDELRAIRAEYRAKRKQLLETT